MNLLGHARRRRRSSAAKHRDVRRQETRRDDAARRCPSLESLARHIEWHLKERPFYVVFEDELQRYWLTEKINDSELERQIQAFAESHGWNVFIHNTHADRTRAVFLAK